MNIRIYLLLLMMSTMLITGCTKSDKEIKKSTGTKSADMKNAGKVLNTDTLASRFNWTGKNMTGQHTGFTKISGGESGLENDKKVDGNPR